MQLPGGEHLEDQTKQAMAVRGETHVEGVAVIIIIIVIIIVIIIISIMTGDHPLIIIMRNLQHRHYWMYLEDEELDS